MWTPELAYDRYRNLFDVVSAAKDENEATTRLRAIDTVLYEVLGWDKASAQEELYCRAEGYADYALYTQGVLSLIVEAKREGETFIIPSNRKYEHPVGFALLAKECPKAEAALRQALGYAATTGARYIAITNGYQWILALTFVPNQPVSERTVYVFESLDGVLNRFRLFYDCFSPEGISSNRIAASLSESRKAPAPAKLSSRIPNYPAPAGRNLLVNELSTVLGAVWDTMQQDEESEEFLRECYVVPEGSDLSASQAVELLERRLSAERKPSIQAVQAKNVSKEILATPTNEKPVVVLGRIGHGKSTFLRYLKAIRAKEILGKYIQIHINFLDRPDRVEEVGHYIYSEVERQLLENYSIDIEDDSFVRGVLHSDLLRFAKSTDGKAYSPKSPEYVREELACIKKIKADSHIYLKKAIAHLRNGRQFAIAIFFDNLDRRPTIQDEAYLRASAIARDWSAVVFVCLRPTSFYHSKSFGVIDSVAPRIISVTSPHTKFLIAKRLKYAKKYAEGDPKLTEKIRNRLEHAGAFSLSTVSDFLECMIESFRRRAELSSLFDSISNGNIRELLGYVYEVLTSSHLDTGKILSLYASRTGYTMPEHEALRTLLYHDSKHYNPEESVFINLFDIQRSDHLEHFTRFLTLHYLRSIPEEAPYQGWCELVTIERYLSQLGYSDEHARSTLRYLVNKKCCESRSPVDEWTDSIKELRLSERGKYLITSMAGTFQYIDAIVVDTPILEDRLRTSIQDVTHIDDRLHRSVEFAGYLDRCSSHIHDGGAKLLWAGCYAEIIKDIERVKARVRQRGADWRYES